MQDDLITTKGVCLANTSYLRDFFKTNKVPVYLETGLVEIGDGNVTLKDKEGLDVLRHTCSHVLAQAVKNIFPTSKLAIGPTVENGFYYDIEFKTPITQQDLAKIESEMTCCFIPI